MILFPTSIYIDDGLYGRVDGNPVAGRVSSPFGHMRDIFRTGTLTPHTGVDLMAALGTPLKSPGAGVVLDTFHLAIVSSQPWIAEWKRIFGNSLIVQYGDYVCLFAHLSAISVREGQKVGSGDEMGKVGSTGMSTGPHLHWGMARVDNRYFQSSKGLLNPLDYCTRQGMKPPPVKPTDLDAWGQFFENGAEPLDTVGGYHRYIVRRKA
jgi:murein DD-endopeptidase MepM/ murein hydrolase activator NlpD